MYKIVTVDKNRMNQIGINIDKYRNDSNLFGEFMWLKKIKLRK